MRNLVFHPPAPAHLERHGMVIFTCDRCGAREYENVDHAEYLAMRTADVVICFNCTHTMHLDEKAESVAV